MTLSQIFHISLQSTLASASCSRRNSERMSSMTHTVACVQCGVRGQGAHNMTNKNWCVHVEMLLSVCTKKEDELHGEGTHPAETELSVRTCQILLPLPAYKNILSKPDSSCEGVLTSCCVCVCVCCVGGKGAQNTPSRKELLCHDWERETKHRCTPWSGAGGGGTSFSLSFI